MIEGFAVISGNASNTNDKDLKVVSSTAQQRYASYKTAHHEWVNSIPQSDYRSAIENIRNSKSILDSIKAKFPNTKIENVTEADEVYWAVSPKFATGSDRALVDCHYDSPFGWFPTGRVIFYRVIIATNENNTVTTIFPDEDKKVRMTTGDFHGLDYNKDWHCVEGKIPPGKFRVLLKLHYLITPPGSESYSDYVKLINVAWTQISRETMRMSADPKNPIEWIVALIVGLCRIVFNHTYSILGVLILGILIYFGFQKKRIFRLLRK